MQIFIPHPSPIHVAQCLDPKRLNKQVVECDQIMKAIKGETKAWANHPVVKMYSDHLHWVKLYRDCLYNYRIGNTRLAIHLSNEADKIRPKWMTRPLCYSHRRRLVEKDPIYYKGFYNFGISEINYYIVDNKVLGYVKGKCIKIQTLEEFNQ